MGLKTRDTPTRSSSSSCGVEVLLYGGLVCDRGVAGRGGEGVGFDYLAQTTVNPGSGYLFRFKGLRATEGSGKGTYDVVDEDGLE